MTDTGKEKIQEVVIQTVHEIAKETGKHSLLHADIRTRLYGPKSDIDSLLFVRIITDIEERFSDELNRDITLINENTLKQERSPFDTLGSLIEYMDNIINPDNA